MVAPMVERQVRPVSGEIMTVERDARSVRAAGDDIVDAEFETVEAQAPRLSAHEAELTAPERVAWPDAEGPVAGMDMLRREAGPPAAPQSRRGGVAFWTCGAVLALAAFWISGGHTLAGPLLATFGAKQERLRIAELSSRVESHGGRRLLIIDGAVVNQGTEAHAVPPLLIEVTGDGGRVTRYTLDPAGEGIAPGAEVRFSSRVDVPIGGVAGVSVKMSER